MGKQKPPTYSEIIQDLLSFVHQPISINELIDNFLEIRVPQTKNPRSSILDKIREEKGRILVFVEDDRVLPIDIAYHNAQFRLKITKKMLVKRIMPLDEFGNYFIGKLPLNELNFLDENGSAMDSTFHATQKRTNSFFGSYDESYYSLNLNSWFKQHNAKANDHIIITIHNYQTGTLRLSLEKAVQFNHELVAAQNQQLADILYQLLEREHSEQLLLRTAIPTAYALIPDKSNFSPISIERIIVQDDRMTCDGWNIMYSDGPPSLLESILAGEMGISTVPTPNEFSPDEGQQVYRFKVNLKHRKSIWREIEIQGEHTLAEFNDVIMKAFDHDWDHMGGFWKLVPRKAGPKRIRYREVNIGSVNPFGGGDGAEIPIAGLGLSIDDRLKYVYDFGDWIEHEINLKDVEKPLTGIKYPRIANQNKPRYQYCQRCKKHSRKTIANWICITCSDRKQEDVLVCEGCLEKHHDNHFANYLIY